VLILTGNDPPHRPLLIHLFTPLGLGRLAQPIIHHDARWRFPGHISAPQCGALLFFPGRSAPAPSNPNHQHRPGLLHCPPRSSLVRWVRSHPGSYRYSGRPPRSVSSSS